ncbi:MAG: hypothetical protein J7L89_06770, partial [Bacteroidales bacterium]|nr:hypothetical protein [Bacteroidales bacterium]
MKRKLIWILSVFVFLAGQLYAQESNKRLFRFYELFWGVGTTHYFGDIGGAFSRWPGFLDKIDNFRDFDPLETRLSLSFGTRYLFNRTFAISGEVAPAWLSGDDYGSIHADRGWSFNTYMIEFSGQLEYYWLSRISGVNPYLFAGFGGTARYTIANFPNPRTAMFTGNVLIGGIGFRYSNNKKWTHSGEIGYRYALSDYIEMYKSNTGKNDGYYLVQYKLTYHLTRGSIYTHKGRVRKSLADRWRYMKKKKMTDEE